MKENTKKKERKKEGEKREIEEISWEFASTKQRNRNEFRGNWILFEPNQPDWKKKKYREKCIFEAS